MVDKNIEDIPMEEKARLDQLVTEALMRDRAGAPNVDGEWERLSKRLLSKGTLSPGQDFQEDVPQQHSLRAMWTVVATVAAIALVVVLINIKGLQADKDVVYEAQANPTEVMILDAQKQERVVKGKELKMTAANQVEEHTIVVPNGKDIKIRLADGTEIWLNANSKLTYPTAFTGKDRRVSLQGEAFFKVAHDARHPFIVKAGDLQTKVLGTQFNVDASDAAHPHVSLVEGSVKVSSLGNDKVIAPGEDAAVGSHGEIKVTHVEVNDVACWREGVQLFDNVSLRDILIQMGSWYNVSVVCHDEVILNNRLRYMYDRNQSIEEAIKMLNGISNNKIKLRDNTILVE